MDSLPFPRLCSFIITYLTQFKYHCFSVALSLSLLSHHFFVSILSSFLFSLHFLVPILSSTFLRSHFYYCFSLILFSSRFYVPPFFFTYSPPVFVLLHIFSCVPLLPFVRLHFLIDISLVAFSPFLLICFMFSAQYLSPQIFIAIFRLDFSVASSPWHGRCQRISGSISSSTFSFCSNCWCVVVTIYCDHSSLPLLFAIPILISRLQFLSPCHNTIFFQYLPSTFLVASFCWPFYHHFFSLLHVTINILYLGSPIFVAIDRSQFLAPFPFLIPPPLPSTPFSFSVSRRSFS